MSTNPRAPTTRRPSARAPSALPSWLERIARPLSRLSTSRRNLHVGLASDSAISVILIVAGLWYGHLKLVAATLTVVLGLFAFTFLEYAAHRWLFHGHTGPFEAGHDNHHLDPLGYDALPFFMPPLFMCALAVVFALAIPAGYALLLAGIIAAGYAAYGLSHVVIHVRRFKSPLMRRWAGFHNIHHYHPDTNFGVTTGLWDVLLGTRYHRKSRRAANGHA
ncbi:MAG TPA: sterol desaturase family protein [Rhodanobacteraceae bacterium]|nr:sterol desaturase family protein [Rhodanobacteraceae bacterium]